MKKQLILPLAFGVVMAITTNSAFSMPEGAAPYPKGQMEKHKGFEGRPGGEHAHKKMDKEGFEKKRAEFDQKLGLTEAQKAKAKELRLQSRQEMEPIMAAMKAKYEEMEAVKNSVSLGFVKDKKIKALEDDMTKLKEKADALRKKNMEEFEKILTPEQKTNLETMKQEAKAKHQERKRGFEEQHAKPTQKQ